MLRIYIFFLILLVLPPCVAHSSNSHKDVPLRFGVISLNHPLVMYRQYLPFTSYLASQTDLEIELVVAKNYQTIVEYFVDGTIDIALLAGVSYVEVSSQMDIEPLCAVRGGDKTPRVRSVFITREDRSDIDTVSDFRDKSFAFGSLHSTSSYLQPLGFLLEHGLIADDFSSFQNFPTQDAVIRAVLQGKVDGGVVSELSVKRYQAAGLKRVAVTPAYPGFVIAVSGELSKETGTRIQQALFSIDYQDPETALIVQKWSAIMQNGFAPISEHSYDKTRLLMEELREKGIYP